MNLKNKKFTIIITTYKRAKLLRKNIKNLLDSEFEFELLILNDGSPDDTDIVVKSYLKDTRVSYFKNSTNKGYAYSLNKGIELSKNEWIFLCEDDAFIINQKKFFEILIKEMKDNLIIGTYLIQPKYSIIKNLIRNAKKIIAEPLTNEMHQYNGKKRKYVSFVNNCFAFNKNKLKTRFDELKFRKCTHRIESDFQIRARREGAKIIYNPQLIIDHKRYPLGGIPPRNEYNFIFNHLIFLNEYYSRWKIFIYILLKCINRPRSLSTIKKALKDFLSYSHTSARELR